MDEKGRLLAVQLTLRRSDETGPPRVGMPGNQGLVEFRGVAPGRYELRADLGRGSFHKPKSIEVEPGDTVTIVLERHPHVEIYFVDATTGKGLDSQHMETWHDVDGVKRMVRGTDLATLPVRQTPRWVYTLVNRDPTQRLRLQARWPGYEPSPWIDAPADIEPAPLVVKLPRDATTVGHLTIEATADTDERVGILDILAQKNGSWLDIRTDLVDGKATLALLPGTYVLHFGGHVALPERPGEWWVPLSIETTIAPGQRERIGPTLVRGGFVTFRNLDAITDLKLTRGDETHVVDPHSRRGEEGDVRSAGPFRAGHWTYTYVDSEQRDRRGAVEVVAGSVTQSTPEPPAAGDEDDGGDR